ncbi:MAG: histidinol-phosphatase [Phycisphaerae bacterium]|nr:histidinol-phosphatase [Phycisphaerae bacterium]
MRWMRTSLAVLGLACAVVQAAEPRREILFPDVPGYTTLKCDLHIHTVFSDGAVWPTIRVDEAWREGLDAIAITDHIQYRPFKDNVKSDHNRAFELAEPLARQHNILLVRGTELTYGTPPGHFNAIFLKDATALDTEDFYEAFDRAAEQGAFIFWDHPSWQGEELGQWGPEQAKLLEKKQLHGIEVANPKRHDIYGHGMAIEKNLVMVGNSDIHPPSREDNRTVEEHRPLTLAFAKAKTNEALREVLFAGRTAVWRANRLIGREAQLRPMFEACVSIAPPHRRDKQKMLVEMTNRCEPAFPRCSCS